MYNVGVRPSYATGFAQWPGMSEYPELWRGLVGAWDMSLGQTGSKLIDWSGKGNHGTLIGDTHWISGKFGTALDFDGTGDWVLLTALSELSVSNNWSFGIWLKNDDTAKDSIFLSQSLGANDRLSLGYDTSLKNLTIAIYDGSWTHTSISYDDNNWHHVVVTWDGTTLTLYFDNVATTSGSSGIYASGDVRLVFGARDNYATSITGQIDKVAAYDHVLSASEIAQLYQFRKRMA